MAMDWTKLSPASAAANAACTFITLRAVNGLARFWTKAAWERRLARWPIWMATGGRILPASMAAASSGIRIAANNRHSHHGASHHGASHHGGVRAPEGLR